MPSLTKIIISTALLAVLLAVPASLILNGFNKVFAAPPAIGCQEEAGRRGCVDTDPGPDGGGGGGGHQCGNLPDDADNVKTKFNFGCLGSKGPAGLGPIQDMLFALIRFLSIGVGIAVTLALIAAGIQYSTAEGNPESSQKAKLRVQHALIGLAVYIFAFSALQFLIPGGIFNK